MRRILWPALLLISGAVGAGAGPVGYEELRVMMEARTFAGEGGKTLPYRLFVPDEKVGGKLPLVLCMHGAGGRGSDNEMVLKDTVWSLNTLASESVQKEHPCILVAPQCPPGAQWVDTPWSKGSYSVEAVPVSANMALAMGVLDAVLKEFEGRVDLDRIYVVGFSMGGYATWDLILRNPGRFAAAVPVCGAGDPSKAVLIKDVPVWVFHGTKMGRCRYPVRGRWWMR